MIPVTQGLKIISNDFPEYTDLIKKVFIKSGITKKTMTGKELKRVNNVMLKLVNGRMNSQPS